MKKELKKELKGLMKELKKCKNDEEAIEKCAINYFNKGNTERLIVKLDLEIKILDIEKIAWLSVALIFISPAINAILSGLYAFICFIALYVVVALMLSKEIKKYLFYKKYLQIIQKIKDGVICKDTKEKTKTIKYNFNDNKGDSV